MSPTMWFLLYLAPGVLFLTLAWFYAKEQFEELPLPSEVLAMLVILFGWPWVCFMMIRGFFKQNSSS